MKCPSSKTFNLIAPTKTSRDWSTIDRCLDTILGLGCGVVMVIGQARPPWATAAADYGAFCGEVAARYRDKVSVWELWNEPNQRDYWGGDPDPKAYAEYVKAAHPQIKAVQPESTVLLAGMQHITRNPWADQWRWAGIPEITFLQECYAHVPHFGDYFDAAATHVYSQSETYGFLGPQPDMQLDNLQQLVEIHQLTGRPVWVTEAGYWTTDGLTEQLQAEYLKGLLDLLDGLDFVPVAIVYNLRDSAASTGRQDNCGLLKVDYTPKPAFNALIKGGILSALSDEEQRELFEMVKRIQDDAHDTRLQMRGPGDSGWPQLGQNDKGQNLTLVDAFAAFKKKLFG